MTRKIIQLVILVSIVSALTACTKQKREMLTPTEARIQNAVPDPLMVILVAEPDPQSHLLRFQDFIRNGKSFIPIFRSRETFQQATRGTVKQPAYQIDRKLFISLLQGQETLILDAGLPEEIVTDGATLKRIFPEPFKPSSPTPGP